jgi:nicotinamidase-related amidase
MTLDDLEPSRSALLVIDMQNAFCAPDGTLGVSGVDLDEIRATIPRIRRLVDAFDSAGIPVIWTLQEHLADDARRDRKQLAPHTAKRKAIAAQAGTWDAAIVDELASLVSEPHLVVRKHRFGGFYETRLDVLLQMLGVDCLFVTGATTNACVDTTLREAYMRDYDLVAVDDCIGGVNSDWSEITKEIWAQYFCELANFSEVTEWLGSARPARAPRGDGNSRFDA